jgi:hypothetical protein
VVHLDRPKHAYLNPMRDPRIRPRRGFAAGGDGVWVCILFYTGFQNDLWSFYILSILLLLSFLSAVLDQVFVPDTTDSILDIGDMVSILQGTQRTGSRVQLVGVTGDVIQVEITDVTFPVLTVTNEIYVIDTTNSQ